MYSFPLLALLFVTIPLLSLGFSLNRPLLVNSRSLQCLTAQQQLNRNKLPKLQMSLSSSSDTSSQYSNNLPQLLFTGALVGLSAAAMFALSKIIGKEVKRNQKANSNQCPYCTGKGKLLCAHCMGKKHTDSQFCSNCHGTGLIECINCKGDGLITPIILPNLEKILSENKVCVLLLIYHQVIVMLMI